MAACRQLRRQALENSSGIPRGELLGKLGEQGNHLGEDLWRTCKDIAFVEVVRLAGEIADYAACFGNQQ